MNHRRKIEKPKDFKQGVKNILLYLKPFYKYLIIAVVLAFIGSISSIIGPDKIKEITNLIVEGLGTGIDLDKIKSIAIFLISIYMVGAISSYLEQFIMATITNRFSKKVRGEISVKINKLPLKYFDKTAYGDVLSRVTNDVDTMSEMVNQSIGTLVSSLTLLLGSLFMMFKTNYILAFVTIGASLIGFLFMTIVLSKSQKYFVKFQEELGNLNGHIEETYSGHNIVKIYNGTASEIKEFDLINNRMFKSALKSHFFSGLMHPFMGFIGNLSYVLVCVVGAALALNGTISFGVIIAFTIYARLFSQPLSQIAQVATSLQSASAASERVFDFLSEEEMDDEKEIVTYLDKKDVKGEIEFRHVKFGYDEEKTIIKDFSSIAHPGDKIAIVGPTGAGKTTLVNLLEKFYPITSGDILIDGVSIKNLSRENIHDLFIMVLQDTWVFEGSIMDNIIYNKENVSEEEVKEICKKIGLDHIIKSLNKGYDTMIGDSEILSAGEKQLLTIARGMVKNSPFLILDEATSSVDTRTEELVSRAMDSLCQNRTSFIIAHRLSTIKNADLILVLDAGNVVEQGTHEELLHKNGVYAKLYNSQFESNIEVE
ncbi:MAG: ABC transporter ATP-binding protein [Bacilli bacterium]|nr:ABC transporter ATP-binding protein [Bacilli bacterium]